MSDVDAFTQRMLDRARQRRENLDKKMAETITPRKRPAIPLSENQENNLLSGKSRKDDETFPSATVETGHGVSKLTVQLSSPQCSRLAQDQQTDHDSPNKKQCTRTEEKLVKEDTPAIPSVRSRLHGLAALRNPDDWAYDNERMEVDSSRKSRKVPECQIDDGDYEPKPASRRNRLAALAQTINTWEDDLSRPVIKHDEKPKKIWQPPKAPSTAEPAQPTKPSRTFEYAKSKSPAKAAVTEEATSDFMKRIAPSKFSPAKHISPVKFSPSKAVANEKSPMKTSPVKTRFFPSPKPVVSTMTVKLSNTPSPGKSHRRQSGDTDMDEPTKRPISARFAVWEKKSTEKGDVQVEPTKQPVSTRMLNWENKAHATTGKAAGNFKMPTVSQPVRSPTKQPRRDLFDVSMHDPLNMSVHSRMGVWEKKVDESEREKQEHVKSQQILKSKSPLKSTAIRSTVEFKNALSKKAGEVQSRIEQSTGSNSSVSPMKSPGKIFDLTRPKVGKATKELHARLTKLDENWKNNEIAEKIKQQKEADMALLQTRWKNGVLNEDDNDRDTVETNGSQTVPVPPPPPVAAPRSASPQKSSSNTPSRSERREEARDKIRAVPGAIQSLGSLISKQGKNFEQKLSAMGFEMTSSKTATLDLTPIKEKERTQKANSPAQQKYSMRIEETKLTTTRFGNDSKVHVSAKTYPVEQNVPPRMNGTPVGPSTPSIYNLIKKTPAVNTPRPMMGKLHDSFDSDDSFDESDRKNMPPPGSAPVENTKVTVTTTVKRRDSLSSTQSETQSEYSEVTDTHTEDYTEDYTEEDESEYSEEEYSSEDEESEMDNQLDDLLDEAMDDTVATETESETGAPVAPSRRSIKRENSRQNRPVSYHGSTSSKNSRTGSESSTGSYDHLLRYPNETRADRDNRRNKRGVTFAEGTTPTTSELSSTESEEERPQVYSIDLYRSSWNMIKNQNKVTPKMTIVRHSEHSRRREEPDEPLPYVPEKSVRQKLQELQELVNQEQIVIQQTSNALNQCCGTNSMFAGSAEAVECHRLLLIACKKREAYITEMQRLRDGGDSKLGRQPQGSLTLSDIRLPLKKDFMSRIGGPHDTSVHYFICMIRNGAHVVVTQMMSTHDAMVRDSLDFPNLIQLKDIKQNFRFDLEIYGMAVTREIEVNKTPKKQKKGLTPKKWLKGSTPSRNFQSPAGPSAVRSTNFVLMACLPITIKSVTKAHFSLDKVPYSSPLQGTIHLKLRCLMESSIIEKGFLTIFEDVSGFGAWHRRWFVLKNQNLSFWKYPDDEKTKEPIGNIDLKYCISEKIGLIPRDICARPNTFEILTVRRHKKGEKDTLTSWISNTVSTTRHMLSADTKEDRLAWCERINEALSNVRSWSPEALRPIKVQAVEDPTKPLGGNKYQHMTNM